ncbi:MAG: nucleoside 2-deoxyribosyltransferase domain-containing protein [Candidatus Paceibacterota bacterium]
MKVIFAGEPIPKSFSASIFLAGPTKRGKELTTWRVFALRLLEEKKYDGVVFVPEPRVGWDEDQDYQRQVAWEHEALNHSDCVLFWVPRDVESMPGFTTNVEFGFLYQLGKVVFGAPPDAHKVRYLEYLCQKEFLPQAQTLSETVDIALAVVSQAVQRQGGECCIPLFIWHTPSFQQYYNDLRTADNRIDGAKLLWTFRVGANKQYLFSYIIQMNIWVEGEQRNKVNEFVFFRSSISCVVVYCPCEYNSRDIEQARIVLVKEFRSPVSNISGYVFEVPGGSTVKNGIDPRELAAHEVFEETGLDINPLRLKYYEDRQLTSTLSSHKAALFSLKITPRELKTLQAQASQPLGVVEDSERTYRQIVLFRDLLAGEGCQVDWSMVGMISRVIMEELT